MKIKYPFLFLFFLFTGRHISAQYYLHFAANHEAVPAGQAIVITPHFAGKISNFHHIKYYVNDSLFATIIGLKPFQFKSWEGIAASYTIKMVTGIYPANGKQQSDTQYLEVHSFLPEIRIQSATGDVLFVGIRNELKISVTGFTPDKYSISIQGQANLQYLGNGNYTCQVLKPRDRIIIKAAVKYDSGMIAAGEKAFTVAGVPAPSAMPLAPLNRLQAADTLYRLVTGFTYMHFPNIRSGIDSFKLRFTENNAEVILPVTGDAVRGEILSRMRNLPAGTWVYFEQISLWYNTGAGKYTLFTSFAQQR